MNGKITSVIITTVTKEGVAKGNKIVRIKMKDERDPIFGQTIEMTLVPNRYDKDLVDLFCQHYADSAPAAPDAWGRPQWAPAVLRDANKPFPADVLPNVFNEEVELPDQYIACDDNGQPRANAVPQSKFTVVSWKDMDGNYRRGFSPTERVMSLLHAGFYKKYESESIAPTIDDSVLPA